METVRNSDIFKIYSAESISGLLKYGINCSCVVFPVVDIPTVNILMRTKKFETRL